jgi:hypothetical protein
VLIEHGAFIHDNTLVWAGDWYGRGQRLVVAQSADVDAAQQLAARLQALLAGG